MAASPSGTVTFLFTDIEGSTELWQRYPDTMAAALADHDRIVRATVERHNGYIFATGGDGFAVAFANAIDGVQAAVGIQRALDEGGPRDPKLKIRIGLHTGTAHERGGDYFGLVPTVAARVMAAGHGDQILMTDATRALTNGSMDTVEAGTHQLPGLDGTVQIHQVVRSDLRRDFPPLRVAGAMSGNLPRKSTSFVGDPEMLDGFDALLDDAPVLTLTGVGGIGKTRLAVEIATRRRNGYRDGVWFVELAEANDITSVAHAIATSLRITSQAGASIDEQVVRALQSREALVVLDNCEHVLDPVADLIERVLAVAFDLRILVTTREPLDVDGEVVRRVRSLDADGDGGAVRLFVDRARAVDAGFDPDAETLAQVRRLCERLDGVPLAIELAASQVDAFAVDDILDRLDARFQLLAGSRRRRTERHQTLRATVDWSYRLLSSDEQALLDRLGVFGGSFDLPSVEAVCGDGLLDPSSIAGHMAALVRKSLLTREYASGQSRYRLLETLRQYARERLTERGEADLMADRHLDHYAAALREATVGITGPDYRHWAAKVGEEWDNLRTAFHRAIDVEDLETVATSYAPLTAVALFTLRYELFDWINEAIATSEQSDPASHHRWLYASAASGAWAAGDITRAEALISHASELATDDSIAPALSIPLVRSLVSMFRHRPEEIPRLCEVAEGAARRHGDDFTLAQAAAQRANALGMFDLDGALDAALDALDIGRRLDNDLAVWNALQALGHAWFELDRGEAVSAWRDAYELAVAMDSPFAAETIRAQLLWARALEAPELAAVADELGDSLNVLRLAGDWAQLWTEMALAAAIAVERGASAAAAQLLGSVDAVEGMIPLHPSQQHACDRAREAASTALGQEAFETLLSRGRSLTPPQAVALATDALARS